MQSAVHNGRLRLACAARMTGQWRRRASVGHSCLHFRDTSLTPRRLFRVAGRRLFRDALPVPRYCFPIADVVWGRGSLCAPDREPFDTELQGRHLPSPYSSLDARSVKRFPATVGQLLGRTTMPFITRSLPKGWVVYRVATMGSGPSVAVSVGQEEKGKL